jgi:hypothetical protein
LLIFIQFVLEQFIDDVPEEVVIQEDRMEFIVSKIIDKVPDEEPIAVSEYKKEDNEHLVEHTHKSYAGTVVAIGDYDKGTMPTSAAGKTGSGLATTMNPMNSKV